MNTRAIEQLWRTGQLPILTENLLRRRPENSPELAMLLSNPSSAASLALLRLAELAAPPRSPDDSVGPFLPLPPPSGLADEMVGQLLSAQRADGGWGGTVPTALSVRSLSAFRGTGDAQRRALCFLADNQGTDGLWGLERRPPGKPFPLGTAYVLFLLGDNPLFRRLVRFDDAVQSLESATLRDPHAAQTARLLSLSEIGV